MKTIEEKAEAYDAAIERAREWSETKNGYYTPKELCEEIFPELAESEDEKIRKMIINHLTQERGSLSNDEAAEAIAWLEKQGSEPNWCHHKVDLSNCPEEYRKAYYDGWNNCNMQHSQCKSEGNDVVKCLINGMKFYYEDNEEATWGTEKFPMKVKDILSWLEKQGEQKSTECIKFSNEFENQISHLLVSVLNREHEYNEGFVKYVAQSLLCYAKNELNPTEWSEEDELKKNAIISLIKEIQRQPLKRLEDWAGYVDWLESIKYRTYPQLKQEWSEEDEIKIKSIIAFLKSPSLCAMDGNKDIIDENVKYLKSLKDRVQPKQEWSEEDEKILDLIIQDYEAASRSFCGHRGKLDWLKSFKKE